MPTLDIDHTTGAHCGSTSLRDLSAYYGWGFDEPTCFGLGEGLGFSYLTLPESPHRAIFGRTGWLERAFFDNLGLEHTMHQGETFSTAWEAITARIDRGDPVMIFTDLYYLDYYDTDTHFAPHSLLVVGYDAEDSVVHLADSEFDEIQTIPLDRLELALTSEHVVPLQCWYLTVESTTVTTPFPAAAATAIEGTAKTMLSGASHRESPVFRDQGIDQIEAFEAELPEWGALPDPQWTARFAYQNIERRGTGGGAFRRLYAAFLDTASESVSLAEDLGAEMHAIAEDWTELAETLRRASECEEDEQFEALLTNASEQADAIADREGAFYGNIREFEG